MSDPRVAGQASWREEPAPRSALPFASSRPPSLRPAKGSPSVDPGGLDWGVLDKQEVGPRGDVICQSRQPLEAPVSFPGPVGAWLVEKVPRVGLTCSENPDCPLGISCMKLTFAGSVFRVCFFFFWLISRPGSLSGSSDSLGLQPPGSMDSLALNSRPPPSPALHKQYSTSQAPQPLALCHCPRGAACLLWMPPLPLCFLSTPVWLELPRATQTLTGLASCCPGGHQCLDWTL